MDHGDRRRSSVQDDCDPAGSREAEDVAYAVVTAARDEASNLPGVARCIIEQTVRPVAWVIVENGSTDGTLELATELAKRHPWIHVVSTAGDSTPTRGGRIASVVEIGLDVLRPLAPDVVAICDGDVSMGADYFRELLARFAADPRLGIASGCRYELVDGTWRPHFGTAASVEGQCRAYRADCLAAVLPLEKQMGWDGVDTVKANILGWRTVAFRDLPFRHHRTIGARDRSRIATYRAEGRGCYFMGYRLSYLVARTLFHAVREPPALAMVWGYIQSALVRTRRAAPEVQLYVRRQQRLRELPERIREVKGRVAPTADTAELLLVADSGGHLFELVAVADSLSDYSRVWVTLDKADARSLLNGERVHFGYGPTTRSLVNLARNFRLAWRLVRSVRPKLVVTTGAALGVPFAWAAKLLVGADVILVETLGALRPSLTGRLMNPIADRVFVQWPEHLAAFKRSAHAGTIFGRPQ